MPGPNGLTEDQIKYLMGVGRKPRRSYYEQMLDFMPEEYWLGHPNHGYASIMAKPTLSITLRERLHWLKLASQVARHGYHEDEGD
jgi:hypothetical protein